MKKVTIWNNVEKSLMYDTSTGTIENGFHDMKLLSFDTKEEAKNWIDVFMLDSDYSYNALEIIED